MKLVRFGSDGRERPGVLVGEDAILDVSREVSDYDERFFAEGGLDHLRRFVGEKVGEPDVWAHEVRIGPPIATPEKIVCIGLNYADHAAEAGFPLPSEPMVFFKAPNTIVGPEDEILVPRGGTRVDWEVELAVVIGRRASYLRDETEARSCIAGFAVANDLSERAFQLDRGGEWSKGKSCETFNPLGPWLLTADEVPDPQGLRMWLRVNGVAMQESGTTNMVWSAAHLVWYLSQFMVLTPGDVINTGTPGGVGNLQDPPRFLQDGDVVEAGIDGLGAQRSTVRKPDA
jgi:2,4-didehydro-3-deoxy-L-rhamnonate hydrolase